MLDPLPPTLPVEPTALFRTAMVVIGGLVAWVAWVFVKVPVRPRAIYAEPADAPVEESTEAKVGEPEGEKAEAKAEEKSDEPKAEAEEKSDEPKGEAEDAKAEEKSDEPKSE